MALAFSPVLGLCLGLVRTDEGVDNRDLHQGGRRDDLVEVVAHRCTVVGILMEGIRVVAEPGDLDPLVGEPTHDLIGLPLGQSVDVDVADAAVASGGALVGRPATHLEHREAVGGAPVGDVAERCVREGGGQESELHGVCPPLSIDGGPALLLRTSCDGFGHEEHIVAVRKGRIGRIVGRTARSDVGVNLAEQGAERCPGIPRHDPPDIR